jgi:hypothetical protein
MYYTIYKVTNQVNGKIYIGSHKTKNLNDNYMGSGKYLKRSQEKHGIENFTKEILFVFDSAEEMYSKEAEIVNEDFIAEENTYNLKVGGFGGWDYIHKNELLKGRPGTFTGKTHSEETKRKIGAKTSVAQSGERNSQYGTRWIHSLEEQRSARIGKDQSLPEGWLEGRKIKFI